MPFFAAVLYKLIVSVTGYGGEEGASGLLSESIVSG